MLLYHVNFGWPLVDEDTRIECDGEWQSRGGEQDNQMFRDDNDFRTCPAPREDHRGGGEAAAFHPAGGRCAGLVHRQHP